MNISKVPKSAKTARRAQQNNNCALRAARWGGGSYFSQLSENIHFFSFQISISSAKKKSRLRRAPFTVVRICGGVFARFVQMHIAPQTVNGKRALESCRCQLHGVEVKATSLLVLAPKNGTRKCTLDSATCVENATSLLHLTPRNASAKRTSVPRQLD